MIQPIPMLRPSFFRRARDFDDRTSDLILVRNRKDFVLDPAVKLDPAASDPAQLCPRDKLTACLRAFEQRVRILKV